MIESDYTILGIVPQLFEKSQPIFMKSNALFLRWIEYFSKT